MTAPPIGRRRAALALLALPATASFAQAPAMPASYAVISEFAREVRVTVFQDAIGSRLDTNPESRLPMPDGVLDKVALLEAKATLGRVAPVSPVWLISPLDADLLDARGDWAEGSAVKLPPDLADALKQRGSTHLIAFTRHRAEANLRAANDRLGSGRLEGIGFYVDRVTAMKNSDTLTQSTGFIAPYLYMRATLVDVRSGKVLRSRTIAEGQVLARDRPDQAGDIWNVMSPKEKVERLSNLIKEQVGAAVAELVAAR